MLPAPGFRPAGTLYGSASATAAYRSLLTRATGGASLFEDELGVITNRSIVANEQLRTALPAASTLIPAIPANNGLASQLNIVARIIAARVALGAGRQVFFVSLGGFDHHDFLLSQHAGRLALVNGAVDAFYAWLVQLEAENQVTLFTASDFGRTLTSNGDGSDHGWGSHHFVLGGAVAGGDVYGTFAPTSFGTSADVGQGNTVPGVAVDQYAAYVRALARRERHRRAVGTAERGELRQLALPKLSLAVGTAVRPDALRALRHHPSGARNERSP